MTPRYKLPEVALHSYENFKKETQGKGYDVDGVYGAQCWDGAALLWSQLEKPRNFSTGGTGGAKGTWQVQSARKENAGTEFELITDPTKMEVGDIFVSSLGTYGHVGYVDSKPDLKTGTFTQYAQNLGGKAGGMPGSEFKSSPGYKLSNIIGAFRYKKWTGAKVDKTEVETIKSGRSAVESDGYTWINVKTVIKDNQYEGWVAYLYVDVASMKTTVAVNLRKSPTISADILVCLQKGTLVEYAHDNDIEAGALSNSELYNSAGIDVFTTDNNDWIKVKYNGKVGFVVFGYVGPTLTATMAINLREEPKWSAKNITVIPKGAKVDAVIESAEEVAETSTSNVEVKDVPTTTVAINATPKIQVLQAIAKEAGAYKANQKIPGNKPPGLFWHSTGANNPNLTRWAGTSPAQNSVIGENKNKNSFYYSTNVCPHYSFGRGTDGKLYFAQHLDETICCWCSGSGNAATAKNNGFSGNNANFLGYTQIEIGEDGLNDANYATQVYEAMVEFSVNWFKRWYNGDANAVTTRTLINHKEANKFGIGSNHGDTDHWLPKFGFTMDKLRADVKTELAKGAPAPSNPIPSPSPTPTPSAPSTALKVGDQVQVKSGAKTYTGGGLAAFVYSTTYILSELKGDRAVIKTVKGEVVAAVNSKDLIKVGSLPALSKCPYTIRLDKTVKIYASPSSHSTQKGTVGTTSVYTIVEESYGVGAQVWGRLKSGAGWVAVK